MLAPGGRAHEDGMGRMGPAQRARAGPGLPRGAFGPWPRASAPAGPRDNRGFGALSASARTRVFHRDGRGRRQDAGRRAHVSRRRPGGGRPRDTALRGRARRRVNRGRLFAGRSHRRDVADPRGSAPRADAAPLSNASGSAPSRTGRTMSRITVRGCFSYLGFRLARSPPPSYDPPVEAPGEAHGRQRLQSD